MALAPADEAEALGADDRANRAVHFCARRQDQLPAEVDRFSHHSGERIAVAGHAGGKAVEQDQADLSALLDFMGLCRYRSGDGKEQAECDAK